MDKYEYNLKLEEIDKLVDQGDYDAAAKLADSIEWRRVRNVRTLCLISEIYEAAGQLDKSKDMLVRAYRKSPVGRTVLYRLVEVTTALGQFDEALEYYSEYVQTAPHDNNRYILKYMIYKGRGSSPEELIPILEEYLGQEYTERWAYELATVYQQAGQIQKCLAACDDLVLWFHSGKYVKKALDLKKRYAMLTPKQQQIYDVCLQEDAQSDYFENEDEEGTTVQNTDNADDEVIAENIIAQTEKEIAEDVAARKAEMEKAAQGAKPARAAAAPEKEVLPGLEGLAPLTEEEMNPAIFSLDESDDTENPEQDDLQVELARSVRKVISGVARNPELNEDDVPAAVEERLRNIQEPPRRREEPESKAGKLSIDDILLSMGEKGRQAAAQARAQREAAEATAASANTAEAAAPANTADPVKEAASADEAGSVREAENTNETMPVKEAGAANDSAPADMNANVSADRPADAAAPDSTDEAVPAEAPDSADEAVPAEAAAEGKTAGGRSIAAAATEELTAKQLEAIRYSNHPEKLLKNRSALPSYSEDTDLGMTRRIVNTKEELQEAARKELLATRTIRIPTEEVAEIYSHQTEGIQEDAGTAPEEPAASDVLENTAQSDASGSTEAAVKDNPVQAAAAQEAETAAVEDEDEGGEYYDDPLTIEPYLRGLFRGFTEIDGLEDQIANAILQAMAKGDDRTSRTGNLLIFGPHGSGKTTLATGIAKAIAQEKGLKTAKMARIYASDLNRRDIAATIAKIAGGTLIVEEAGDLDDNTVDQMTTAMEFRTDGLIVILEDEQRYVHELLMKHPRFTMKFTAQIYLPVYTADELSMFAQQHANGLDYMISEDGFEVIRQKVAAAAPTETPMSVADVITLVDQAIRHSNKFMRKMSMGKKRYDENDYVLLFAKDFK
ncbi:MAG: ATP-binding protein [Lachnospiraceae bacterium]|nr:ATP-binding protein [Lachnospiraceae bacterium]